MKAVHVLVGIDSQKALVGIQPLGQGQLEEDAVHLRIAVQAGNELKQLRLGDGCRQTIGKGAYARLFTGPLLVAYIDLGGRILAHQNDGQSRSPQTPGDGFPNFTADFSAHIRGCLLTI